jgi:hypothetical protein
MSMNEGQLWLFWALAHARRIYLQQVRLDKHRWTRRR